MSSIIDPAVESEHPKVESQSPKGKEKSPKAQGKMKEESEGGAKTSMVSYGTNGLQMECRAHTSECDELAY